MHILQIHMIPITIDSLLFCDKPFGIIFIIMKNFHFILIRQFFLNQQTGDSKLNPEKPDVPLNKNDAFQKVQKRHVQEKR